MNDRSSFTLRRKKWCLGRDKICQAPFKHDCDTSHPLQVHHILPHAYLNHVATKLDADYPENLILLCRTAHEVIHPDVVGARQNYNRDNETFKKLRQLRTRLLERHQIYWNDTWDRSMMVIALVRTRKYIKKHKFPIYTKRNETLKKSKDSGLRSQVSTEDALMDFAVKK